MDCESPRCQRWRAILCKVRLDRFDEILVLFERREQVRGKINLGTLIGDPHERRSPKPVQAVDPTRALRSAPARSSAARLAHDGLD